MRVNNIVNVIIFFHDGYNFKIGVNFFSLYYTNTSLGSLRNIVDYVAILTFGSNSRMTIFLI